jgi:hypothetical protein
VRPARLRTAALAAGVAAWALGVVLALGHLASYKAVAGESATPPSVWPAGVTLARRPDRPILVMLAHPRCPCTRASLDELRVVMSRFSDRLDAHVLFVKPEKTSSDFARSDIFRQALSIPGLSVHEDPGGALTRRFGAFTSGQVLLYRPDGQLAFSGGITLARGHAGANPGRARLLQALDGAAGGGAVVFGCPLRDEVNP